MNNDQEAPPTEVEYCDPLTNVRLIVRRDRLDTFTFFWTEDGSASNEDISQAISCLLIQAERQRKAEANG